MALLIILVILAATVISLKVFKFLRRCWILHKIPIPRPGVFPFVIEIFYPVFKLGLMSAEDRFEMVAGYACRYGDLMKIWFGHKMAIFVSGPDRIQKVLMSSKCLEKWNLFYELMERKDGLITASTTRKWKEHRKFFNFSFSLTIIESFVPTFVQHINNFCRELEKESGDKAFDFFGYSKRLSFDILCATSLGINGRELLKKELYDEFFDAFETTELAMNQKFEMPYLYPKTFYKFTRMYREERKAQKVLDRFQRDVINERRKIIQHEESQATVIGDGKVERNILIDHIILNEDKFTGDEIRDHILTFVSGYETWANALAHAMLMLAMHPDVQDKLFDEIQQSITSDEDPTSSIAINKLEYLDMVLKEIFRLMPPVPMVLRETTEDFEFESGLVIPKGVNLIINFYALHRREDIWGADVLTFKPERFSHENSLNRHPFAFLPYASGSRICIGMRYSNLSIKLAIARLIQSYKFSTTIKFNDLRLKSYISMKLCTEHLLKIERR